MSLAITVLAAACAAQSGAADPTASRSAETNATRQHGTGSAELEPTTSTRQSVAGTAPAPPTNVVDNPPLSVAVSGGDLPDELVDGYTRNGGDLVDPAEWRTRFGSSALPELTGPGIRLVESLRRTERVDARVIRTDEAVWLAMSRDDRDTMMRSLRDAARIEGEASRATSSEQAADCVIDSYPADSHGVSWQLQGCSYETFPGLVSLGVSRTGPTDASPAVLDVTVASIAATVDGSVTLAEARLGEPAPDGSTLRLSAQLSASHDVDAATLTGPGGPLAGWQTFPGDGSVLLSGPTGSTWTLSGRVAVFSWGGRW